MLNLVTSNCFMASLDIKDAYYSIPIHEKFLENTWNSYGTKHYTNFLFSQMVLSPCLRWFTKILKPPLAHLRELMYILYGYIDDIYLQGQYFHEYNMADTIKLFLNLGFTIHPEKLQKITICTASTKIDILAFHINSVTMQFNISTRRKIELLEILQNFSKRNIVKY